MNRCMPQVTKQAVLTIFTTFLASAVMAGRPLATDDAGTAEAKTCQVESWIEKQDDEHAWVISPACGLVDGVGGVSENGK